MHNNVNELFDNLWQQYLQVTPSAQKIHQLLSQGEAIVNDHIALRTFNLAKVNLEVLAAHFKAVGYEEKGQYDFAAKKLTAKHFEHSDPDQPKVFISELRVEEFSPALQTIITELVEQVDASVTTAANFVYNGAPWQVSQQQYQTLLAESEYAAWTAAWGYRANHFTVHVNKLKGYQDLEAVNDTLKQAGYRLNTSGGEIKGSEEVLLKQSSTMADTAVASFSDGDLDIPSCFYEFAQRYNLPNGQEYTGFVAASADKIFESTNTK
ncbi:DUF1338 domain-containing protein [Psychrobium sp. 1_MG-2023]|uniref:DUF1338 domain-containing protein n=1 Tax=Psychrobium sp. 1_MG-2023 TaxID=3062624 RepID=UPI000C32F24D|nr:DUF1338 domain-containing protein [Psychrobium sp. 1_MG-2023]MDP2560822.1 DUF1338 domain-containing protein [Psychrobium sp. 1_MG-2023]PKF56697.1 DUF1338 domain-containing protein [Alteromonadales bacterium alter-6D02]